MAEIKALSPEVEKLKRDLEGYRQFMLPLKKILEWEQNFYPAVVVGIITFIFAIIWYLEPSVLTTFCLLGIIVSLADFFLPTIGGFVFGSHEWTVTEERQYEAICERIHHARQHRADFKNYLTALKRDKPTAYLLVLVGTFAILAWLGSLIDNLLLTYLLVVIASMLPGLRKHGILQQLTNKIKELTGGLKKGAAAAVDKPKTN